MMWLTEAARDMLIFGLGMSSGVFIAWQIWLYHDKEMTRLTSRRGMGVDRDAKRRDAQQAKEGQETTDHWRWN